MRFPPIHHPRLGILLLLAWALAGAWMFSWDGRESAAPAELRGMRETAAPAAAADLAWTTHHRGVETGFVIALDEAVMRDADGAESLVRLDPPATRATLAFRLARLAPGGGGFPVAYPMGKARSDETRVLVTPELRVRVEPQDAETVAVRAGLKVTERPDYTPGWVIMRAPDALAALDSVAALRAATAVAEADVLLAARRFSRAMPDDPLIGDQWHLKRSGAAVAGTDVNIEAVWNFPSLTGTRGAGVRIGIVDNGVQLNHPDLTQNMDTLNGWDWNGNDSNASPGPGNDHGTACAGLAAARGNNGKGVSGAAPMATIVPLRLLAASVTDAQEAAAMAWKDDIIHIKNNSWGPSDSGGVLDGAGPLARAAIQSSVANGRSGRGTIFVWAAGNGAQNGDNSNNDGYANLPETIAVAATDSLGRRANYSEPGANLVVSAPSKGEAPALGITTTDRTSGDGYHAATTANGGDYYKNFTGTSASAPVVSGIVALMLEINPLLGWRDVQEILIRSATKFRPTDPGWRTNSAGIPFHHEFGAGLVNATAAVNLAAAWTTLGARFSASHSEASALPIPRNSAAGLTRSFDLSDSHLRLEHVTLKLDIPHPSRGDLEISLTSPGGMTSRLAERQAKGSGGYPGWTFSSVRHWGEHSAGIWTLHIADLGSGSLSVGTLESATLTLHGSASAAVNPRPLVTILQPTGGQTLSPGAPITVAVAATDLDLAGNPGQVQRVDLIRNGAVEATLTAPPWQFEISPGLGSHTLLARATDSQGATGTSEAVSITVANQPPQVLSATLSSGPQAFADVPLAVAEVLALDPESDPVSYAYQWQHSSDGVNFTDLAGAVSAVLPAAPGRAGRLWRCRITPSDASSSGAAFATTAVNLVNRPPTSALWNVPFIYDSGLLVRRGGIASGRQALLHEFSHGPGGGAGQWIEILALETGSLAAWSLTDAAGNSVTLSHAAVWNEITAGTLIVIYDGTAPKDPLLPADNADPAAGGMILASTHPTLIANGSAAWLELDYGGASLFLKHPAAGPVHALAYGSGQSATPNAGPAAAGSALQFSGDSAYAADLASQWRVVDAATAGGFATATGTDPFFTEYVEGSAENLALEIFNPGNRTIDLAAELYRLEIFSNGGTSAQYIINLDGHLAAGATFVIKHASASASITARQTSNVMIFTGNDAIVLRRGTTLLDRIGQIGVNPGPAGWSANGVSTANATLRRKLNVTQGDTAASSPFDPSIEWDAFPIDDFSGLGSHGSGPVPTIGVTPGQPNGIENAAFIAALRDGGASPPALFRLAHGSRLPVGLALDHFTGEISGTPMADDALGGPYPVTIERYNAAGEVVALGFSLSLVHGSYLDWIGAFPGLANAAPDADPDADGLPNAVEFALGTNPQLPESSPPVRLGIDHGGVFLTYRRHSSATGVSLIPEWSASAEEGSWQSGGITLTTEGESAGWLELRAYLPIDPAHPKRFMRLRAVLD